MIIGHSTGRREVAGCLLRHGTRRVSKAALVSAVTHGILKTDANPNGVGLDVFDSFRASMMKDGALFFTNIQPSPFFGFNRNGDNVSLDKIRSWWQQGMLCGFKSVYDFIKAFLETSTSEDLHEADIYLSTLRHSSYVRSCSLAPLLTGLRVLYGAVDQMVPIDTSERRVVKLCKQGTTKDFPGAPHALPTICVSKVNSALLEFLQS